LTYIFP